MYCMNAHTPQSIQNFEYKYKKKLVSGPKVPIYYIHALGTINQTIIYIQYTKYIFYKVFFVYFRGSVHCTYNLFIQFNI